jgi:hypothetical protein
MSGNEAFQARGLPRSGARSNAFRSASWLNDDLGFGAEYLPFSPSPLWGRVGGRGVDFPFPPPQPTPTRGEGHSVNFGVFSLAPTLPHKGGGSSEHDSGSYSGPYPYFLSFVSARSFSTASSSSLSRMFLWRITPSASRT